MAAEDVAPVGGLGLADAIAALRDELLQARGGRGFGHSVAGGLYDGRADGQCDQVG
jgi:hypothetical protein